MPRMILQACLPVLVAGFLFAMALIVSCLYSPALAREVDYGSNPKLFYRNGFKPTPVMPALPEKEPVPMLCDAYQKGLLADIQGGIQQWAKGVGLSHLSPEVLTLWIDEGLVSQPAELYALTPIMVAELNFTQRVTSRAAIKQIQQQPWVGWPRVLHGILGNILTESAIEQLVDAYESPCQLNLATAANVAERLSIHQEAIEPVIVRWCQWQPWLFDLQQADVVDAALFEDDMAEQSELQHD